MTMRYCIAVAALVMAVSIKMPAQTRQWVTDVLGGGYEASVIDMLDDYSGAVCCTVVRKQAACKTAGHSIGVLYVHGYNDYFFQREMGDRFVSGGYNFYAVDLRKYGRSLRDGQMPFDVRDIAEYYVDVDSAIGVMLEDGVTDIVLLGHSTGGLIVASYMASDAGANKPIRAIMLNSPFLDMNQSKINERFTIPLVAWLSGVFPSISISQGKSNAYAQSIMSCYHGEWDYNTEWKMEVSPAVTSGWLGAIYKAQRRIQQGAHIDVPILLMHSDRSIGGDQWREEFNNSDAVLDVADIVHYGRKLGSHVTDMTVVGGMHDLMLSRRGVREALYGRVLEWLSRQRL